MKASIGMHFSICHRWPSLKSVAFYPEEAMMLALFNMHPFRRDNTDLLYAD